MDGGQNIPGCGTFPAAAPICNYLPTSVCNYLPTSAYNHLPTWRAFQVAYGVLQCGGRRALHCRVDELLPVAQDRPKRSKLKKTA